MIHEECWRKKKTTPQNSYFPYFVNSISLSWWIEKIENFSEVLLASGLIRESVFYRYYRWMAFCFMIPNPPTCDYKKCPALQIIYKNTLQAFRDLTHHCIQILRSWEGLQLVHTDWNDFKLSHYFLKLYTMIFHNCFFPLWVRTTYRYG